MAEPSTSLNVAVWGLGRHAFKNVLPAVVNSGATNLIGVYSRTEASRSRAAKEFACGAWSDEESMLSDRRVDLVYLATPIGVHLEQGLKVLNAGRHLICEKSLTNRYQDAAALVSLARDRQLLLCEAFMYRFHPRFRSLVRLVQDEKFGEIVAISCNFYLPKLENPGYRYTAELGGGAFWDAGCYPISLALALDRSATIEVESARIHVEAGAEVDTVGIALLRSSVKSHASLGWGYGAAYRNEATIIGEKQSVHIDFPFAKGGAQCAEIALRDGHGKEEKLRYEEADGFVEMLAYAQKAISNVEMKRELWSQAERQAGLMEQVRAAASRLR